MGKRGGAAGNCGLSMAALRGGMTRQSAGLKGTLHYRSAEVSGNLYLMDNQFTAAYFPKLTSLTSLTVDFSGSPLTVLSLPVLTSCNSGSLFVEGASFTTLSLPVLSDALFGTFTVRSGALTTLSLPALANAEGAYFDFTDNALSSSQVDAFLVQLAALGSPAADNITLDISNQTPSAPPGTAGLAAISTLEDFGGTITTD